MVAYGLNREALKLVYSYLNNRVQKVKTGSTFSSSKKISIGVSQGSLLGPLLFNRVINDLFFVEMESEICNFADDTTIYAFDTHRSSYDGMKANASKFHIMFLGRKDMNKLCHNISRNLIP